MNNKKQKIHDILFIIIFLIILILPLCFFHSEEGRRTYVENKVCEPKPDLSVVSVWDSEFTESIENYINDRIGFRDELILANISFKYTLFGDFQVTNFMSGKDQHIFYMNDSIMDCYQGLDEISNEQMTDIIQDFEMLNASAEDAGIEFVFMPVPNKEEIYPEYMPDDIKIISENSMLKSLNDKLIQNTDISVVDLYTALENEKSEDELLYYRNIDASHWNMMGGLIGYLELMNTINQNADENFRYLNIDDYVINKEKMHSALSYLQRFDIVGKTFSEFEDYKYTVAPIAGYSDNVDIDKDDVKNYYHYHNKSSSNEKTIFIVGDSYIYSFLLPLFAENFSDVYFVHAAQSVEYMVEVLNKANPDYVLFEIVARMTNYDSLRNNVRKLNDAIDSKSGLIRPSGITDNNWTNGVKNSDNSIILFSKNENTISFKAGMRFILKNGSNATVKSVVDKGKYYWVSFDLSELSEEDLQYLCYPNIFRLSDKYIVYPKEITDENWTCGVKNNDNSTVLFTKNECPVTFETGMKLTLENGSTITVKSVIDKDKYYWVSFDLSELSEADLRFMHYPHSYKFE